MDKPEPKRLLLTAENAENAERKKIIKISATSAVKKFCRKKHAMKKEKILIIEDEKHISGLIKYNLEKSDYLCTVTATGEDALHFLKRQPVSLIILDIMLPGMDGFTVCRKIKQDNAVSSIPIIMLTAKGEEIDRIVGLETGADDYVVKPFSTRELVLRVKSILKRGKREVKVEDTLNEGKLKIDILRHRVFVNEKEIELTHMEFNLLTTLMRKKGQVQSREQLLSDIWDIASDVTTRTVDTHIKRLRKKLEKMGALIETIRGLGYRFRDED